jgi:hypothetical protein
MHQPPPFPLEPAPILVPDDCWPTSGSAWPRPVAAASTEWHAGDPTRAGSAADEKDGSVTCCYVVVELRDLNP